MNYINHLNTFFDKMVIDNRLTPYHISLYVTLFHKWNLARFKNPISVSREELMVCSKIGSVNTYIRCLKELETWKYIKYQPSKNRQIGSSVYMLHIEVGNDLLNTTIIKSDNTSEILKSENANNTNKIVAKRCNPNINNTLVAFKDFTIIKSDNTSEIVNSENANNSNIIEVKRCNPNIINASVTFKNFTIIKSDNTSEQVNLQNADNPSKIVVKPCNPNIINTSDAFKDFTIIKSGITGGIIKSDNTSEIRVIPYINNIKHIKHINNTENIFFSKNILAKNQISKKSKKISKEKGKQENIIKLKTPERKKVAPKKVYTERSRSERFEAPTLESVKGFFDQNTWQSLDAEQFFNHFESNGWLVSGKTPMKNWHAAARNWMINAQKFAAQKFISNTTIKNENLNGTEKVLPNRLHVNQNKNYAEPL